MSTFETEGTAPLRLYSAGDCPVCADSGAVLCLKTAQSGRLIFFCTGCGVAWWTPPPVRTLDEINSLKNLAPEGVRFPSDLEVLDSGFDLFLVEEIDELSLI